MGFMDFDGVRYWDARECVDTVWFPIQALGETALASDSTKRSDSVTLKTRPVNEAQTAKEELESLQRNDRKLREECAKRRQNNGPKFAKI